MEPTIYNKKDLLYKGCGIYETSSIYKDIEEGFNVPYYSDFINFNTTELYDIPIIGRKEYVKNHQNLIYSKSNIVYGGNTFNALKVTQPGGDIAATDEMFNFGGRDYEIDFIQFIEEVSGFSNFSIWPKLGSNWFGFGFHSSDINLMILSQSNDYTLYNGASYSKLSGGYYWVDTGVSRNTPSKMNIKINGNEVSFFVDEILKMSIIIDDVFMNCLNFSPRYGKSFYMSELKINWV